MRFLKRLWTLRTIIRALWKLEGTEVWWAAGAAVRQVAKDKRLSTTSRYHPTTSFCPRCGQLPDGDRRFEEAREQAMKLLTNQPPRHHLDAALALHYYLLRNI